MCNKVDNNVTVCGCMNARKLLSVIALLWALLGIAILVFFIVTEFMVKKPQGVDDSLATGVAAMIVGGMMSAAPFFMAILILTLLCINLVCLYIIVSIFGCSSMILVGYKLATQYEESGIAFLIIAIVVFIVNLFTLYAMISLAFCGNQRPSGGVEDDEEIEEKDTKSDVESV